MIFLYVPETKSKFSYQDFYILQDLLRFSKLVFQNYIRNDSNLHSFKKLRIIPKLKFERPSLKTRMMRIKIEQSREIAVTKIIK